MSDDGGGCTRVIYPQPGSIFLLVILVKVYFVSSGVKPKSTFKLRHPDDLTLALFQYYIFGLLPTTIFSSFLSLS